MATANEKTQPADEGRLDLCVMPLVERLRAAGAAEDLVALLCEYKGSEIAYAAERRINVLAEAGAEIERLQELADGEGSRAVECLRRARKAEGKIAELMTLLQDCRTWLDPEITGDDDSETLCWRIDAALRHNDAVCGGTPSAPVRC